MRGKSGQFEGKILLADGRVSVCMATLRQAFCPTTKPIPPLCFLCPAPTVPSVISPSLLTQPAPIFTIHQGNDNVTMPQKIL